MMRNVIAAIVASSTLLSGCGGSTGPATPSAVQGLWNGTTDTDRTVVGLVLSDGLFYFFYSSDGNPATIAGVIQGSGSTNGGNFSSSNAKDFNLEGAGILDASVSASFSTKQALNGSVTYADGGSTFTSTYNSDYEVTPSVPTLAGTFAGQVASSLGVENATVRIANNGALSGTGASGCAITGSVKPRTDGNAFTTSISFGGAPCYFANQTFTGISYFDAATKRLYSAAPNSVRSDGVIFVGTKP